MASPIFRQKIKSSMLRKFSIHDKSSYSTFMKHKPKALSQFMFSNFRSPKDQRQKDSLRLLKAIKQLKHVHHLNLIPYRFYQMVTDLPFLKSCAKRMSRTQYLSTKCLHNIEASFPKESFQVWPKYIHHLKNLTDIWNWKEFLQSFGGRFPSHLFKYRPQKFFRYQNRLESLEITFENFSSSNNYLYFGRYPTSVKKLSFSCGVFTESEPVPSNSLDHFKSLKALQFFIPADSSVTFINSLINLLPKVPQLESLSFFSPLKDFPELKESVRSMKALTMLKHVKIHTCHLVLPHSKVLLKVLRELPLTNLYLRVRIENLKEVNLILNLLGRLTQLQTLKLHIDHENVLKPSDLEKVFKKIDKLDNLKHLSLSVTSKNDFTETIQLPFSHLFTKQTPLESFRIESNHLHISNEAFLDLLKSLQNRAPNLKKIKLGIGQVLLDKKEFKKLLKFLQNIHQDIRVLKLSMLGIYHQSHFMEIVATVQTMKYLRSLSLGKFYMQVTRIAFWKGVKKILEKRGLVKFNCDASKDFQEKILAFASSRSGINWSMLKKNNPALIEIPDAISFHNEES